MTKKTPVKKTSAKRRTKKKDAPVTPPAAPLEPVTLPLAELYVYKLQLLTKNLDEAKAAIARPLQEAFEAELRKRIEAALAADEATVAANSARADCINEVLESVKGDLPKDYAVSMLSPENATITAVFSPEQKDQRLEK